MVGAPGAWSVGGPELEMAEGGRCGGEKALMLEPAPRNSILQLSVKMRCCLSRAIRTDSPDSRRCQNLPYLCCHPVLTIKTLLLQKQLFFTTVGHQHRSGQCGCTRRLSIGGKNSYLDSPESGEGMEATEAPLDVEEVASPRRWLPLRSWFLSITNTRLE